MRRRFCGKVFKDAEGARGAQCCVQPSAGLLKSADVAAACGVAAAAYLGETKDGAACRLHFQAAGGDAAADVRDGQPSRRSRPARPRRWAPIRCCRDVEEGRRCATRSAFEAVGAADPALLEKQTVLWAGPRPPHRRPARLQAGLHPRPGRGSAAKSHRRRPISEGMNFRPVEPMRLWSGGVHFLVARADRGGQLAQRGARR